MSKSRNRKLIESLFKQIEKELGYHIVDKQFGNCYFIVESKEPDTICHFHIKELPGYLFGIWNICRYDTIQYEIENNLSLWSDNLHISSKSELIFFTQYEKEVDKFKPSRSGMVTGLRRITYEEDDKLITEWDIDELEVVLNYMKNISIKLMLIFIMRINLCIKSIVVLYVLEFIIEINGVDLQLILRTI